MISATFDEMNHSTAVSGVYQYDTGQRLRLFGLPSPDELAMEDEFLSGDIATVQVHYGMRGDSQTESRLAQWDEERGCWIAAVPDHCMLLSEDVYAFVYVGYGIDEAGNGRTKTQYSLTFRPISRPAPNNVATSEQWEAWADLEAEVDLVLSTAKVSIGNVMAFADSANTAAQKAKEAAKRLREAGERAKESLREFEAVEQKWNDMAVRTVDLAAGSGAYVTMDGNLLTYGIPRGADGEKGATGDVGPADISLSISGGVLTITQR